MRNSLSNLRWPQIHPESLKKNAKFFYPWNCTPEMSRKPLPLFPITSQYRSGLFSSAAQVQTRSELGDTAFLLRGSLTEKVAVLPQTHWNSLKKALKPCKYRFLDPLHFRVVSWPQRVLKTIWKPHKSKEHNFLHRRYIIQKHLPTPKNGEQQWVSNHHHHKLSIIR